MQWARNTSKRAADALIFRRRDIKLAARSRHSAPRTTAPTSRFFGLTFRQYRDAVSPAIQLHEQAEAQRRGLSATIRARDIALAKAMELRTNASFGIGGDPKFGEDSLLYDRFGYVRKSARRRRRRKR